LYHKIETAQDGGTRKDRKALLEPKHILGFSFMGGVKMDLSSDQAVTIECKLGAVNSFLNLLCAQVDLAGAETMNDDVVYLITDAQENLRICREILYNLKPEKGGGVTDDGAKVTTRADR